MAERSEREKEAPELVEDPQQDDHTPSDDVADVSRAPEEVVSEPIAASGGPLEAQGLKDFGGAVLPLVSFALLVLLTVAVAIPWASRAAFQGAAPIQVTLWNGHNIPNGGTVVVVDACSTQQAYAHAAAAFMIINIAVVLVLFCISIRAKLANRFPNKLVALLLACIWLCALISWAIGVAMYYRRFCDIESFENRRFDLGAGIALTVTAWLVATVMFAVALWNPTLPPLVPEAARMTMAVGSVTVAAALAFVFSVVGTPVVAFHLWTDLSTETQTTIWDQRTYVDGVQTSKLSTTDLNCGRIDNMFMFSRGSAILSIAVTLATALLGARHLRSGPAGMRQSHVAFAITAFFAFVWTLMKSAADLAIFYQSFCSNTPSMHGQNYRLRAGFALFAASFVMLFAALCFLVFVKLTAFLTTTKAMHGHTTVGAILFLAGVVIASLFVVLATNQPLVAKNDGNDYIRLFWWDFLTNSGGAVSYDEYPCDAMKKRLAAGGAWCIISLAPLLLAFLFGVAQLSHSNLRRHASICGLVAAVAQLISWALGVATYHGSFCSAQRQSLVSDGYYVASGLGLLIAAWCLTVVLSLVNLRF